MPHTDAGANKKPLGRMLVATASLVLLAALPACGLLGAGGEALPPGEGGDPNSEIATDSAFPTDEEFQAQKEALNGEQAQANSDVAAAGQITDLASQLADEKIKSAGQQGTIDDLVAQLAASETSRVEAVSSTLDRLATQLAASEASRIEAVSSTIAEFTSDYISLERARLEAIRYARDNPEIYGEKYLDVPLAWELKSEEESKEFYYIRLNYRPSGTFLGTPGVEEFIMDKEGKIEFRQILQEPNDEVPPPPPGDIEVTDAADPEAPGTGGAEGDPTVTQETAQNPEG